MTSTKHWNQLNRREHDGSSHDDPTRPMTSTELESSLRAVEPAVRLALPRLLRRVIRVDNALPGFGFRVPHGKSYVLAADRLLKIADRSELGLAATDVLPAEVILLEKPQTEIMEETPGDEMRLRYWELLFHARVHAAYHRLAEQGRFSLATCRARIERLGMLEFEEISNVLRQERFLLPPYDDASTYIEFAAVYLGIRYFKPYLTASFFPGLASLQSIDRIVAEDIDADELLRATRLPRTPDPEMLREAGRAAAEALDADPSATFAELRQGVAHHGQPDHWARGRQRSETNYQLWSARAEKQSNRGNFAGAASRRARAEYWAPRERAAEAATGLREEIDRLVSRLMISLGTQAHDPRRWRESLLALAHQTPRGLWTIEARLLHDLQRVCVDHERTISTVDVMHWVLSLGRRPIRRELPNQRETMMSRHLRGAQRRLPRVRISDRQRRQLSEVLGEATETAETRLRTNLRPKIVAALDDVGLVPANLPETVSRKKLIEELLDRIVDRGFLTLGEVRDAISRNQLKEPDCSSPASFVRGDAALRTNGRLAVTLDGVYEPADFYLRWILRFSHLMFGTSLGRFLTLYLIIPFGGAYVALKGSDHLIELIAGVKSELAPSHWTWADMVPNIAMGTFLVMVIHVARFRQLVWECLKVFGRAVKFLLIDAPQRFLALPWVAAVVQSAASRLAFRYVIKPLVPTLAIAAFVPHNATAWQRTIGLASLFFGLNLAINSRAGRSLEEMCFDAIGEGWLRFGVRPMVGLFWFIVDLFRRLMQLLERLLYTVDEWLRFRSGQSVAMLCMKASLGVGWFFIAYFIRFCVNLLIEPQLNPLKHVPWVSVSHKIMAPIWFQMGLREHLAQWMSLLSADVMTFVIVTGTPGIFGFLIWELKENWRLFAANRPTTLRPALVGSHGETVPRLLRLGFHSGTIPKRFAKLRRAERKALQGGDPGLVRKHREMLHHLEIDFRRFIEREFLAWFVESPDWKHAPPQLAEIHLSTNRVAVALQLPSVAGGPLMLTFALSEGRLQADISGPMSLDALSPTEQNVLSMATRGLMKISAIEDPCIPSNLQSAPDIAACTITWQKWLAAWKSGNNPETP